MNHIGLRLSIINNHVCKIITFTNGKQLKRHTYNIVEVINITHFTLDRGTKVKIPRVKIYRLKEPRKLVAHVVVHIKKKQKQIAY